MNDKERRKQKWCYIQDHMPELAELILELKAINGKLSEPLLFNEEMKPLDQYTRRYIKHNNVFHQVE